MKAYLVTNLVNSFHTTKNIRLEYQLLWYCVLGIYYLPLWTENEKLMFFYLLKWNYLLCNIFVVVQNIILNYNKLYKAKDYKNVYKTYVTIVQNGETFKIIYPNKFKVFF